MYQKGKIPYCAWGRLEEGPFPSLKSDDNIVLILNQSVGSLKNKHHSLNLI